MRDRRIGDLAGVGEFIGHGVVVFAVYDARVVCVEDFQHGEVRAGNYGPGVVSLCTSAEG